MKYFKIILFPVLMVMSAGCASYRAAALHNLNSDQVVSRGFQRSDVRIVAKAFNRVDCKKYLDRDVLKKGYQPVQLYIENNTNSDYFFSPSRINLPCADPEEVALKVHTSTAGRAMGYGIAAFVCWPFVIPAVVDGVKSSEANELLDHDFVSKTVKDRVIPAHSHINMLMFVPLADYHPDFSITLIDENSHQAKIFPVYASASLN